MVILTMFMVPWLYKIILRKLKLLIQPTSDDIPSDERAHLLQVQLGLQATKLKANIRDEVRDGFGLYGYRH